MPRDGRLYDEDNTRDRDRNRPAWRVLEVVVKEDAAVEVSILELAVPRFSFRVGTAHFPKVDGDPITVSPYLTIFNARDGVELLRDLEVKYTTIRENKIEEVEARKQRAIRRTNAPAEVIVRRTNRDVK